jgi:hypothetical protein
MSLGVLAVFALLMLAAGGVWALAWLIGSALNAWFPEDDR